MDKQAIWRSFLLGKNLDPSGDEALPEGTDPAAFWSDWEDHLLSGTSMADGVYRIDGMDQQLLVKGGKVSWINGATAARQLGNPAPKELPASAIVDLLGVGRVSATDDLTGWVSSQKKGAATTTMPDGRYQIDGMDHQFLVRSGQVAWINGAAADRSVGGPPPTLLPVTGVVDLLGVDRVLPTDDLAGYVSSQRKASGGQAPPAPAQGYPQGYGAMYGEQRRGGGAWRSR